jgi:hypothetical protein
MMKKKTTESQQPKAEDGNHQSQYITSAVFASQVGEACRFAKNRVCET